MMKRRILLTIAMMFGFVALPFLQASAYADSSSCTTPTSCIQQGVTSVNSDSSSDTDGSQLPKLIKLVVNIMLFILGAVAVIMIIIGGIRYTTSNGDAGSIKGAKDTILYSIIGLVAILAYAIVNFVVAHLTSQS